MSPMMRAVHHAATFFILFYLTYQLSCALDCTNSKQEWMRIRYTSLMGSLPPGLLTGSNPDICPVPGGSSCCEHVTEREMFALGRRQLAHQASTSWLRIAEQMNNDSAALEYFFRSDLEEARSRLHQFFSRIYGYNYKLHRNFFFRLFTDLEQYMAGQRGQLAHLIENFFNQLRDNIVSLIERSGQNSGGENAGPGGNAAGSSQQLHGRGGGGFGQALGGGAGPAAAGSTDEVNEARRIRCLSDRVAQQQPFDDVDVRLKARMLEAYPPARMLVNVLSVTSRLLSHLAVQVGDRPECVIGMTRYRFCAICAGQSPSSVCPESCARLLSSCFRVDGPEHVQLAAIWSNLIDAIVMTTARLERSFNFPAVNRNLQMEISEAITSLQARYEQTKSKFQSECRVGSSGRGVPTLFSSGGGSSGRGAQQNNRPMGVGWPQMGGGFFRHKRNTVNSTATSDMTRGQIRRAQRSPNPQVGSPAAQEFIDWQTRQMPPMGRGHVMMGAASSPHYGQNAQNFQHQPAASNSAWGGTSAEAASDLPERLMRWAAQLKRTYTGLNGLFAVPGASLCPPGSTTTANSGNATGSSTSNKCWNPPELTTYTPHQGMSNTLKQLAEAVDRLRQTAANNGDPETIRVHIPSEQMNPGNDPYQSQGAFRNMDVYGAPPASPTNNQLSRQKPWHQETQSAVFNAQVGGDAAFGSGIEQPSVNPLPPVHQQPQPQGPYNSQTSASNYALQGGPSQQNQNSPFSPPNSVPAYEPIDDPNAREGSGVDMPQPYDQFNPSVDQQWPSKPDDATWANQNSQLSEVDTPEPEHQTEPQLSTTVASIDPTVTPKITSSAMPVTEEPVFSTRFRNTTVVAPTLTVTPAPTEIARVTPTSSNTPRTTRTKAPTEAQSVVVPPLVPSWHISEKHTEQTTTSSTPLRTTTTMFQTHTPTHDLIPSPNFPGGQSSNYGALPDDEDSIPQPNGVHPSQMSTPSPAQPKPSQQWPSPQNPPQPTWWENSSPEGSAVNPNTYGQGQQYQPDGSNFQQGSYSWTPGQPGVSDAGLPPPGYDAGSGENPPYAQPEQPFTQKPVPFGVPSSRPAGAQQPYGGQSPQWPQPAEPFGSTTGSGFADSRWTGATTDEFTGNMPSWQDSVQGSGATEPTEFRPPEIPPEQNPDLMPQPIIPPPPVPKPPPAFPQPPLPPPEVWVPAEVGPGQPFSSVLLVREYNVQGPFYGPESINKQSLAGSHVRVSAFLIPSLLLLTIFYIC
ncbi:unnamed protein product [Calicophoron daubneyi]|uniref:Glypican n=1 Tax=Calicophoron daubneyi TaxID=300641 RepID=A0AAV2TC73_CALDB